VFVFFLHFGIFDTFSFYLGSQTDSAIYRYSIIWS